MLEVVIAPCKVRTPPLEVDTMTNRTSNSAVLARLLLSDTGKILSEDQAWEENFGYPTESTIGDWFINHLHPDSKCDFLESFIQLRRHKIVAAFQLDVVRADGSAVRVSADAEIDDNNGSAALDSHPSGIALRLLTL